MTRPRRPREFWPTPPRVAKPWPTTVLWRWRYELIVAVVLFLIGNLGTRSLGWMWTLGVLMLLVLTVCAMRRVRRSAAARIWCVATQHRLRTGLARAWVHDRRGRLPAVVWTSLTAHGEQILLWCPAGVTGQQVDDAAEVIRSACLAADVEVRAHLRYPQLVFVHVVRR